MSVIEQRLKDLNLELPDSTAPLYHYVPLTIHQGVAYISGQVPRIHGEIPYPGKVGQDVTIEQAQELAEYQPQRRQKARLLRFRSRRWEYPCSCSLFRGLRR